MNTARRSIGLVGLVLLATIVPALASASDTSKDDATREIQKIDLWSGKAPVGNGQVEDIEVWITVHHPAKSNGTAIVICPGGGYHGLAKDPEGFGIAKWLNRHEIAGIVLEYRMPGGRAYVPLMDTQRAIRTVRLNSGKWQIDPTRVGIMGFSAGGHLASTAATHFDQGNPTALDAVDRFSCRPDFAILVYPVITMGEKTHAGSRSNLLGADPGAKMVELFSNEKQVTEKTPPTFLAHPLDDTVVVIDNSRLFAAALKARNVPHELLELPEGGHGLNGYRGPMWDAWQEKSLAWLMNLQTRP